MSELTIKQPKKQIIDLDMIKNINYFEQATSARVKDIFYLKDLLTFVVFEGDMYKALGKNLQNLHKVENALQRKVKIVEFNSDIIKFITNLLYPYKVNEIRQEGKIIIITDDDTKTKGLIIGAKAQNLRAYETVVKKYFEIDEMKVV